MELKSGNSNEAKVDRKKTTVSRLVFEKGVTNLVLFLNGFEKCSDLKKDEERKFKIRKFVSDEDKQNFSSIYLKGNWQQPKSLFIKLYSEEYTMNKFKELNLKTSIRSKNFSKKRSKYTTIKSLNQQIELILSELPVELSNLFLLKEKLFVNKYELFDFCDILPEEVQIILEESNKESGEAEVDSENNNNHEIESLNFICNEKSKKRSVD